MNTHSGQKWVLALMMFLCGTTFGAFEQITSDGSFIVTRMNNGQPIVSEAMFQGLGATDYEAEDINGPSVIRIQLWLCPARERRSRLLSGNQYQSALQCLDQQWIRCDRTGGCYE